MAHLRTSLTVACSLCALASAQPPKLRLSEVQDILPEKYRAELTLDPAKGQFSGNIHIALLLRKSAQTIWLNANRIAVQEATVTSNGKSAAAKVLGGGDDFLGLQLPAAISTG